MNGAHVALVGRVTRAGELKYASTGTAMLRVGVLVEDSKQRDGDPPVFADVVIWGERAEELAERLPKGASVYTEGKVKAKAWTGSDGTVRASLDVSAWKAEPLPRSGLTTTSTRMAVQHDPPAIALALEQFVRDMIDGPLPLHSFEAPTPGAARGYSLTRSYGLPVAAQWVLSVRREMTMSGENGFWRRSRRGIPLSRSTTRTNR